jgi:hypothetical protein
MALCRGDALYMQDPETGEADYFVVAKINPGSVELLHHADARPDNPKPGQEKRRLINKSPEHLRQLAPAEGAPPQKVEVGPLGDVTPL